MHDVRELLEIGKGDAPPAPYGIDDIVAAGRRRRRRMMAQQIGGAGTVAAAVVALGLVVGTTGAAPNRTATRPATAQPAAPTVAIAPLTFTFGGYHAGAYRVLAPQEVTTTYQSANIVADYRDASGKAAIAYVGTLTVYRPGVHPPAVFTSGTKMTVHGQPGFADLRDQDALLVSNGSGVDRNPVSAPANTLAWQYTPGGWVVINSVIDIATDLGYRLTATDEQVIADGFSLGSPSGARMPFRARYLPAGWQVVSVSGRSFSAEDVGYISVIFAPSAVAGTNRIRHFADMTDGTAVVITIIHDQAPPPDAPKTHTACGHLASETDLYCSWSIPNTRYTVVVHDPGGMLSSTQLTAIAHGLTFDQLDQPGTWHPVG